MTPEGLVKMQAVSVGLLLFSMTWAAPTFRPQTVKTKQGCVEEQRMPNEDSSGGNQGNIHRDLAASVYPEPTVGEGTEDGQGALLHPPGQDRYGAALLRNITKPVKSLVTGAKLRREGNQEKRPQSVLSVIPADVNDAKVSLKDIKNQERYLLTQSSPVKSKHTKHPRQTRRSTHYLTHLPQVRKTPSDFEGSGSPDLLVRGDNDVPPFSGDGQHFMHIPGKGGAVGSGPESSTSLPVSGSSKAEVVDPHTNGLGSNEIPGREGHGGSAYATRDKAAQGAGSAGERLVGSSNEITGSTNFRELPGKQGNRIDAGSQNAHQGKVEFHYPQVALREKVKGGGGEHAGRTGYNEIPKSSKGSSSKDAEESKGNQLTLTASQRFPGKGKSQGPAPPSHSLSNEVKSEENHYMFHGQNNLTPNKGMSQRRGSWPSRRPHSHRRASTRQRDSSESSSSGSSSESHGD